MDECEEKNERWIEKSNEYTIHKCYTRQFHCFAVGIVFWWWYFLLCKCSTPIQFGKILFHICYGLFFRLPAFIWALKLKCVHWLQWDTFKICFRCAEYTCTSKFVAWCTEKRTLHACVEEFPIPITIDGWQLLKKSQIMHSLLTESFMAVETICGKWFWVFLLTTFKIRIFHR